MLTNRQAILAAILYADIFEYPLTKKEVIEWAVGRKVDAFFVPSASTAYHDFVFLKKRRFLIGKRLGKEQFARNKWKIAERAATTLKTIPTIELVGVTGGLAMDNAGMEDDIDFFIVVMPGTMWITRLLCLLFLETLRMRRRRRQTKVKNLICLNMFVSSSHLAMKDQDLFVAHEVLQMTPLWSRGDSYWTFLSSNRWVRMFLPHAWRRRSESSKDQRNPKNDSVVARSGIWLLKLAEPLARCIQFHYMERHRTTEVVSDTVLRFHPRDARIWVKEALRKRCLAFHIPLDKIWNCR